MRLLRRAAVLCFSLATGLSACGGGPGEPAQSPAAPTATTAASGEPTVEPAPGPSEAPPADAANAPVPDAPSAAPAPNPVALCNAMCDRVAKKCSESATESCRMNCTQYEHPPAGCDAQVRVALECAARAEDLTCVNIAPESCAADFRRVVACASGKPEGALPEDPTKIPEGWERFESGSGGFSAPLPKGVTEKSGAPEPTFHVNSGQATYEVRIFPAPKDKATQKSLVRFTMGLVGNCSKKLKLFGMVERPERTTIRFQSACPSGIELQGFIVIASGKLFVLQVSAPPGDAAPKDPFFYNFEPR